jgi:hypothetical protein
MSVWRFHTVPGTRCSDGSTTGVGVSEGDPTRLMLVLDGGGACISYESCVKSPLTSTGEFTQRALEQRLRQLEQSPFVYRNLSDNPLTGWTYSFVPYCTGDLHSGARQATYTSADQSASVSFYHVGRANLELDLAWLREQYPDVQELVVVGLSAGGFGSLINHVRIRSTWPNARASVVSDSGPPLDKNALERGYGFDWLQQWNATAALDDICDNRCDENLASLVAQTMDTYPDDRFAILASTQDRVNRLFFGLKSSQYEQALQTTIEERILIKPNARVFIERGATHVLLQDRELAGASDRPLFAWMRSFLVDDAPPDNVTPW